MNDVDGIRLLRAMRKINEKPQTNNMIFGEVTSIDPLEVDIGNGVVLTKKFLYLGQMCRPHKVTIPHSHLVNALESDKSKAIVTTGISAGVATNVPQSENYDVKTQTVTRNEEEGTNERELNTETKNVDLGGAKLGMSINVAGSVTTVPLPSPSSPTPGSVVTTVDSSTFTVTDEKHEHIIPEHTTQDVHFPDTDYEDCVEMEIYPRLKVGDTVLLFVMNNNQMYYVAERIEA